MSANTTPSGPAQVRLLAFNGFVWIFGLVVIVIIGVVQFTDAGEAASVPEEFRYDPWLNPDPVLADDEGDGVYSGADGARISLDDLDPAQPLLLTELDDTYVGGVTVTGPGGTTLTEGAYGGPPEFSSYLSTDGLWVLVPQADVELWVDGFSDERWRLQLTTPPVERRSGTVSGFGPAVFLLDGDATTARVSTRGEGSVYIETVTTSGVTEVFSEYDPTDRSIAWDDSDLVLFVVDAWEEAGWSIEFPTAATPAPTAGATDEGAAPAAQPTRAAP